MKPEFDNTFFLGEGKVQFLQVHYNKDHYVIVQSLFSNICDLFSRIFVVFNEMEIK